MSGEFSEQEVGIFRDDFTNGPNLDFWSLKRSEKGRILPVTWGGKSALQVDIHKGDRFAIDNRGTGTERNEISELNSVMLFEAVEASYNFSFGFPEGFVINDNRLVIAQLKQKTEGKESPFLSLRYINGSLLFLIVNSEDRLKFKLHQQEWRDGWHRTSVRYKIDRGNGIVKAEIDGNPVVDYEGKLGIPREEGKTYFKMGLYRDAAEYSQTVYFSDFER